MRLQPSPARVGVWVQRGFLYLAKLNGLAVTGVATAVASLLATIAVGIVFFGETLSARQLLGVGAAVLGVILVSIPASS